MKPITSFSADMQRTLQHFTAISAIPRGSGNEHAIADHVENFARAHDLFCVRDSQNNVYIRRSATPGYEASPSVILQGHMDMVCEANADTVHDFLRDPIQLVWDGDTLHANGTTLGADNGVAVAIMLMLLEKTDLISPMLECVFTTSEETGMDGMRHFDHTLLCGNRMINLDSAGEGEATAACAGGVRTDLCRPVTWEAIPTGYEAITVTIDGLSGGHSGEDIHKGRTAAIYAMGKLLYTVQNACDLRLISLEGGARDNAIPRTCTAVFATHAPDTTLRIIQEFEDTLRADLVPEDRGFTVTTSTTSAQRCMTANDTTSVIALLRVLPVGVHRMSRDIPGLVETSASLGVVKTTERAVELIVSSRSSISAQLDEMQELLENCATLAGASCTHRSRYPGWAFRSDSRLQSCYKDCWQELYGTTGKIIGIHAGLECGLLMEKLPTLDCISIGPDIRDLHSPTESLGLSSLERLITLVERMLVALK